MGTGGKQQRAASLVILMFIHPSIHPSQPCPRGSGSGTVRLCYPCPGGSKCLWQPEEALAAWWVPTVVPRHCPSPHVSLSAQEFLQRNVPIQPCSSRAACSPREGQLPFTFAHTSRKLESGVFREIYFQLQVKAET